MALRSIILAMLLIAVTGDNSSEDSKNESIEEYNLPEDDIGTYLFEDEVGVGRALNTTKNVLEKQSFDVPEGYIDSALFENEVENGRVVNTRKDPEKQSDNYEVNEVIEDLPNAAKIPGPVVTNFTLHKPLNIATILNNSGLSNNSYKAKKHYFSLLHIVSEKEDEPTSSVIQNININKFPKLNILRGIKDYIYGIKKGLINGINHIVANKYSNNNQDDLEELNTIAAPVIFINKLQRKKDDVVRRFNRIFGHNHSED